MIERYKNPQMSGIWSEKHKLELWQKTELAVIEAKERNGSLPQGTASQISKYLETPVDIEWWKAREEEIRHDLQAWVDERRRHLPEELRQLFHSDAMTSFDTEEAPFAMRLYISTEVVGKTAEGLLENLRGLALMYRHTVMLGRTHGQWAELQTFGRRCLSWYQELKTAIEAIGCLECANKRLQKSKLSGAIGNYTGLDPETEQKALYLLDLEPFVGATQIMPRVLYTPLANGLADLVCVLDKIANDIRLNARSGNPVVREPFGKKQKGSSAMPHKQNTISTEQVEGMARMARNYANMIRENIRTWEERAIEQSCVERVAWPDLFHVVMQALNTMIRVTANLRVYPNAMLREIADSKGTYAASHAKTFLSKRGFTAEESYRIVQLASFVAFGAKDVAEPSKEYPSMLDIMKEGNRNTRYESIREIISLGRLGVHSELEADEVTVIKWNQKLGELFADQEAASEWAKLFEPEHLLRNEVFVFKKALD